jgi:phospholipase/carboxylesterase
MTTLSGPMLAPADGGAPRQAVVLLHGYGADGTDLITLARHWQALLPGALFVAPNAPDFIPDYPAGRQWFPVPNEMPVRRLEGIVGARAVVADFLAALWAQTGLAAGDTLLTGFSQGAMMALHVGLGLDENLLGIIGFSGAFLPPANFPAARPPVCLVHGDLDTVVAPEMSAEAEKVLRAAGIDVRRHVSPGAGHVIAPDGLAFADAFIAERVGVPT